MLQHVAEALVEYGERPGEKEDEPKEPGEPKEPVDADQKEKQLQKKQQRKQDRKEKQRKQRAQKQKKKEKSAAEKARETRKKKQKQRMKKALAQNKREREQARKRRKAQSKEREKEGGGSRSGKDGGEEDPAKKVPAQVQHVMLALKHKRGKSTKAAWNIARWSLTKHGYLKGPYRVNTKLPKAVKQTQKGVRRSFQHGMEKGPLNKGIPGTGKTKFRKFKSMFKDIEKDVIPKGGLPKD